MLITIYKRKQPTTTATDTYRWEIAESSHAGSCIKIRKKHCRHWKLKGNLHYEA